MCIYIGIDISKSSFDACFEYNLHLYHQKFTNNTVGFQDFLHWLQSHEQHKLLHIIMEATSNYWQNLANWAYHHQLKVSVINPNHIYSYGKAVGKRSKTDKQDAKLLARYGRHEKPRLWVPKPQEYNNLNALVNQRLHHKKALIKERTRLETASIHTKTIALTNIHYWQNSIHLLDKKIWQLIRSHSHLAQRAKLLASIPGVGKKTIPILLALITDGTPFENAKHLVSFVGLAPREYNSGSSIHKQASIGKSGRADIKEALFMPAVVIGFGRHRAFVGFVERLQQKGKTKKQIIVALMRKILVIAYQLIVTETFFDPQRHS